MKENQSKHDGTSSKQQARDTRMVPVQFYMKACDKKRLKMYCLANDINMTDLMRDVINNYLNSKNV